MASLIARRAACGLRCATRSTLSSSLQNRSIHSSPVVLKKGKYDALFRDTSWKTDSDEGDLFSENDTDAIEETASTPTPTPTAQAVKANLVSRTERFEQALENFRTKLGPQISRQYAPRQRTWSQLLHLAENKEQLEKIVELFPLWRDTPSAGKFSDEVVEHFIRRCAQLDTPHTATAVFGDYAKNQMHLTLPAAQTLLHSLSNHPIEDLVLATSLYGLYNLKPISSDVTSCAIVTSALFKHGSEESIATAEGMMKYLHNQMKKTGPVAIPSKWQERMRESEMWKFWVRDAARSIDKSISLKMGKRKLWLAKWRVESGHAAMPKSSVPT